MSVFDALTDPTTDALMGLAQGFGAAAMPTRMPTPIGAVLGQGIGGLQQGLATGQALRHSDIQNQQAQMGLNWYKNMTNPQGGGGAPFGAPNVDANGQYIMSPQTLSSLAMLLAGQGKDPTGPLKLMESYATAARAIGPHGNIFQIPGGAQAIAAEAAAKAGGTTLGEAPGKPPVTFAVPVLDQSGRPTFDKDGMPITRPQTMTVGEAHSFLSGQPGGQPSGQPANASAADPFPAWAHQINHGENGTGNPAATNASGPGGTATSTAMGNGQFLAGTWPSVIRSVRPDLAAGKTDEQLLPLRAVPELAQSATEQYARQNAATLANAGLPVNGGTVALAHFLGPQGAQTVLNAKSDAPLSMLPGMGATVAANPSLKGMTAGQLVQKYQTQMGGVPQQTAQVAGPGAPTGANAPVQIPPATPQSAPMPAAPGVGGPQPLTPQQQSALDVQTSNQKAMGEAAASRTRLITTRAGVYDPVSNAEVYRQPEYHEITGKSGAQYGAFLQPDGRGGMDIMGGPPATDQSGNGPMTALPPGAPDLQKHLSDKFANEGAVKYDGAMQSLMQLDQQDQNIRDLNQSGWTSTGSLNNLRLGLSKDINSILVPAGLSPIVSPDKIASWEDAAKVQKQLAFAQARQMGSREAASVVNMSLSATPGSENTPQGYQAISAGFHEMNYREGDLFNFQNQWAQTHNGNLIGAEAAFNQKYTPEMYGDRAISTIKPFPVKANNLEEFNSATERFLPGTRVMVNGNPNLIKVVPARPDAPIPPYIQNNFMQPQSAPNGR